MSLSTAVENSLFRPKNGGVTTPATTTVIKHRFISFLIWQSILSTISLFLVKTLLLFPFRSENSPSILQSLFLFLAFHASILLFSTSIFIISSPHLHKPASPLDLLLGLARLIFVPAGGGANGSSFSPEARQAVKVSLSFVVFVAASALSGCLALNCICLSSGAFHLTRPVFALVGFRGSVIGLFYGAYYLYRQRWVLQFPIIQRPPFFSLKMGFPSAIGQALKHAFAAYLFSSVVLIFLPEEYGSKVTTGKYTAQQFIFYTGTFLVFLCWELSHHLHQILLTKRFIFASAKGSAAAETNPSEYLLAALEESTPKSLLQYLAYLDLCMVCERNVDTWRRAAFFEETGETYRRVISVCLRPLEQLVLNLGAGLEKSTSLSDQLRSPTDRLGDSRRCESFNDFQLCTWCARIVASLTARSRKEDRCGVAQLSGNNAAVISTLLSALLAVETFMGKKTSLQSSPHLVGAAGIKWAQMGTASRDSAVGLSEKRRGSPVYMKAYAMADILRTSIYCIVSAFHDEMLDSAKAGHLEKDWITSGKVLYGTRELLSQKFHLFLDFRAC